MSWKHKGWNPGKATGFGFLVFLHSMIGIAFLGSAAHGTKASAQLTGRSLERLADWGFQSLNTNEGIPNNSIYAMAQDGTGYLWIGTFGGLSRFDGYGVRNYVHRRDDAASLPDNTVRALLPRKDGSLWLGTENAGLAVYDPRTDNFHLPDKIPHWLQTSHIFSLTDDGEGGIWIGTQGGAVHYAPGKDPFRVYGHDRHDGHDGRDRPGKQSAGLPEGDIYCVLVDSQRDLWMGGEKGLFFRQAGASNFVPVPIKDGPGQLGHDAPIWSLFQDSTGAILVGSDATGIGVVDRRTWSVDGLPHLAGKTALTGPHTIRAFVEPTPGVVWVATYGGGLLRIDRAAGENKIVKRDLSSPAPLADNYLRSLFVDRSGALWAGTNNGVSYTTLRQRKSYSIYTSTLSANGLYGDEVHAVGAGDGKVWVGFEQGGFTEIDRNGAVNPIEAAHDVPPSQYSRNAVLAIAPLGPDKVLAGAGGLFMIDGRTHTYRPISLSVHNLPIENLSVKVLCIDRTVAWIGTYNGMLRYDLRTKAVRSFVHSKEDPQSLGDNNIRSIVRRPDGALWIATRHGLDLFDPATERFRHFHHRVGDSSSLPSDNIQPLAFDPSGRLWVGTVDAGIAILETAPSPSAKPVFRSLGTQDGLPSPSIVTLTATKDGTMWCVTADGLIAIDTHSGAIRSYGAAEGAQRSAQNVFSSALLADDTILLPTGPSLSFLPSGQDPPEPLAGPLHLTSLVIPGGELPPALLSPQGQYFALQLASHDGFSATFADGDLAASPDVVYSYRLEGIDSHWRGQERNDRTATYTNLPPGSYVLRVRARKRTGAPAVFLALPVTVTAVYYERTWFRGVVLLLLVLAIYGGVRLYTARLVHRRDQLEREVAARTAELEDSRTELLKANERLSVIAEHDFLTGILNRRGFFDRVGPSIAEHRRTGSTYNLLLIDMDHFKKLNDSLGHAAGDEALKKVATAIAQQLRPTDFLARYGGEEFILYLPKTTPEDAYALAERIRLLIQSDLVEATGASFALTVSIGLASANPVEDFESVVRRADENLYRAKREGRNRTQA
jgi:diguanylate cyclase (GGDEF)-like protein